jgi:hypothetical protein
VFLFMATARCRRRSRRHLAPRPAVRRGGFVFTRDGTIVRTADIVVALSIALCIWLLVKRVRPCGLILDWVRREADAMLLHRRGARGMEQARPGLVLFTLRQLCPSSLADRPPAASAHSFLYLDRPLQMSVEAPSS